MLSEHERKRCQVLAAIFSVGGSLPQELRPALAAEEPVLAAG